MFDPSFFVETPGQQSVQLQSRLRQSTDQFLAEFINRADFQKRAYVLSKVVETEFGVLAVPGLKRTLVHLDRHAFAQDFIKPRVVPRITCVRLFYHVWDLILVKSV